MAREGGTISFSNALDKVLNNLDDIESLKPQQQTSLEAFLSKKDVFACLPTGFGKSLIYQLAPLVSKEMALHRKPVVVVVSPLLALMEQQVSEAAKLGVTAMQIGVNTEKDVMDGRPELLFGSPEAWLLNEKWTRLLTNLEDLVGIVVDEVHLTYKWGLAEKGQNPFRDCFSRLAELRSFVKSGTPIMALTASADVQSRARVIRQLELENAVTVIESPNRTNIRLGLTHISGPHLDCMDWIVQEVRENGNAMSPVLIYCRTLKDVGRVFCYLKAELGEDCWVGRDPMQQAENMLIGMFHSKTLPHYKTRVLSSLSGQGNCRVVVATSALGMGLNFPNISHVIMYGVPEDMEAIVQEVGRAGRDGKQSHAVVYCIKQHTKVDSVVKDMLNVETKSSCFRVALYRHFDVKITALTPAHLCCTFCHSSCKCDPQGCPVTVPKYVLPQKVISPDIVREVTEDDKVLLRDLLEQYELSLVPANHKLYTNRSLCTGFGSELIDAVIAQSAYISNVQYITRHLPVFNVEHAQAILHILNEVFEDVDVDCPFPTQPESITPDIYYSGYFDHISEEEDTYGSSSESGVNILESSD